ncbi:MAG TPA: HlyD family efflux transporter periplasmic adaptor subunit [Nitrospira sp.]|jgi:HlyD family secretion protein|nr:HlyD family efflux transporter periplasmic adaptor subunit [Nitrospira sp.]
MKAVPSRLLLATVAVAVLLGGGYLVLGAGLWNRGLPEGLIQVNGRIEGDHLTVASKFPGRIQELLAREGDHVTAGQVMLRIDDVQTRARVDQARHAWAAIEAQVQAAHTALAVLNLEVPLAIESAQSRVDEAKAEVEKAKAVEHEARVDEQRLRNLLPEEAVAQQQYDQAFARWNVAKSNVQVERSTLAKTTKELAQAELGWKRIRAKEDEVAALERQRDQSEAALNEAESVLADLTIRAPALGTVTARMVDVGEVVTAGSPLFEIVDLDRLYLKVYVPEIQIGKVRLDLPARIHTDAFPDQPVEATVRYIASKAEFTPKEVQTPDERVKLIYPVKLYLKQNPDHRLTPGLPADAVIRWKENVAWMPPRR